MAAMAPSIMAPRCRLLKIQPAHKQQQQQEQKLRPTAVAPIQCMKNGNESQQQLQKQKRGMKIRSTSRSNGSSSRSRRLRMTVKAVEEVAGPASDSVVSEVAALKEAPGTPGVTGPSSEKHRDKPGVLDRGETLSGYAPASKGGDSGTSSQSANGGLFSDARWVKGTWDLSAFTKDAKVDWDGVIDAEVKRRKWLEDHPETSSNEEPVVFDTTMIPWWAWVKRFHLPEAELLNGRAAMVGYFAAYLVDSLTGVGLVDQQSSFLGKLLIFVTVLGVLLVRKTEDVETLKTLAKESTFYDKQWQASWKEDQKPSK